MSEPLNEYDKAEWFDVARVFNRDLSWEEFSRDWDEFQEMKAAHIRQKELN